MKRLKRILFLLILVPFCFSFASCKDKSDTDDNGGSNNNNENVSTESFSVAYDYNLPEKYDFLLTDFSVENIDLGDTVELATIPDEILAPHFIGWFDSQDNLVSESVSSNTSKTINLKGKWNEESIEKFYYTKGMTFEIEDSKALISGFSGNNSKIVLPNTYVSGLVEYPVAGINDSVFKDSNIQDLIINADSISIGVESFKNTNIKEFDFSIVTKVGNSAFENTKISNVEFSSELTFVGSAAFKNCGFLTNVDFADLSIDVSYEAFSGCYGLETISKAKNILNIGEKAFAGCVALSNTNFLNECEDLEIIGANAFLNCVNIESAKIPESVFYIDNPFEGCDKLENLTLSRTYAETENGSDNIVKHIGNVGDTLKTITFVGTTETVIPTRYFSDLSELETFVMCDSILYVRSNAFNNCAKLKNVTLSNNLVLDQFSSNAFITTKYLTDMVEPLIYKNTIIYVPQNIVAEYAIPDGVSKINDLAFLSINNLKKITIPASVDYIGEGAFKNCENLEEVIFEENNTITKIGNSAFFECRKLNKINLSNLTALSEIGSESFKFTAFTSFSIPSSISTIGPGAFMYVPLTEFVVTGTGGKLHVDNGVLYEDVSVSGTGDDLKLLAYPSKKSDSMFVVPDVVSEIGLFAFIGASELEYIYFANASMNFEPLRNSIYNSFEDSHTILRQESTLEIEELGMEIANRLTSGCDWDYENQIVEFSFEEGQEPETGLYFIKYYDDPKYSIAIFRYINAGESSGIVAGSLKIIEKVFNS